MLHGMPEVYHKQFFFRISHKQRKAYQNDIRIIEVQNNKQKYTQYLDIILDLNLPSVSSFRVNNTIYSGVDTHIFFTTKKTKIDVGTRYWEKNITDLSFNWIIFFKFAPTNKRGCKQLRKLWSLRNLQIDHSLNLKKFKQIVFTTCCTNSYQDILLLVNKHLFVSVHKWRIVYFVL